MKDEELLKAHSSCSVLLYLLMHLNASQYYVDEKQDFHIGCAGMESRFLLEATFIHWNQHFPVCLEAAADQ